MTPTSKKCSTEEIIQEWRDYEGNVVRARKLYDDALAKAMKFCKEANL